MKEGNGLLMVLKQKSAIRIHIRQVRTTTLDMMQVEQVMSYTPSGRGCLPITVSNQRQQS